jgi:hypothetical protein
MEERNRGTWERIRTTLWTAMGVVTLILLMTAPMIFFFIILMGPVGYALLNTMIYTALWSMDIAGTVAREFTQKTYDLQCLMPVGTLGINWIICTGRLHYRDGLMRSVVEVFAVIQLFMLTTLFLVIGIIVTPPGDEEIRLAHFLAIMLSLVAFLYLDHIQAIVCGICIALIAARQTRTVGDARLWALLCFLAVQLGWYIAVLLFCFIGVPFLVEALQLRLVIFGLLLPPLVVGLAFLIREGMIRLLWSRVLLGMNADQVDLKLLERYA